MKLAIRISCLLALIPVLILTLKAQTQTQDSAAAPVSETGQSHVGAL